MRFFIYPTDKHLLESMLEQKVEPPNAAYVCDVCYTPQKTYNIRVVPEGAHVSAKRSARICQSCAGKAIDAGFEK